jgi:L-ascorbate oxidase
MTASQYLWRRLSRMAAGAIAMITLAGTIAGPAIGQQAAQPRLLVNPPPLTDLKQPPPKQPAEPMALRATTTRPVREGEIYYDLSIKYTDDILFDPSSCKDQDPTTCKDQKVHLRSYVDAGGTTDTGGKPLPFVAPTINAKPGDTVRITLHNDLPDDPSCTSTGGDVDIPHCFNGTNLHSHGLWVSPAGNSDNVLLSINPKVSFEYEYNIPADHPAGTFWYHPHRHGSTALQVGSGMAGALIIHGDRKPTGTGAANGDLDTLLAAFPDRVLLFQQIQYACVGKDGKLKRDSDGNIIWTCQSGIDGETGVVETYDQFGPPTWAKSGRWTSINGIVLPTIGDVEAGRVERLRLIHAGVRDTIKVQFRKQTEPATVTNLTRANVPGYLKGTCNGEIVPYQVVAADGLTMERTMTTEAVTLQPGYRFDILTVFPEAGDYCIVEPAKPNKATVSRQDEPENFLGYVTVSGNQKIVVKDLTRALVETLVQSAQANNMPPDVAQDLRAVDPVAKEPAPRLTRFVPHPTVTDDEVRGVPEEHLVFFIGTGTDTTQFTVGNSFDVVTYPAPPGEWTVPQDYIVPKGYAPYDPNRIDRPLVLRRAQQWELRSYGNAHNRSTHRSGDQEIPTYRPGRYRESAATS